MGKRAVDVVVGTLLCVVALPFVVVGVIISMVALRTRSPFFFQKRIGHGGRDLRFPKIRTLPPWMPAYALKTNMRFEEAPKITRFLRRMHIDELPQLLLVLKGELSLVGPRPKMPDTHEPVPGDYGSTRVQVPQGCTGLWQISQHKVHLPSEHPEYDLFYVANHSVRLDLWILLRTVTNSLRLTELITLADVPRWALRNEGAPVLQLLETEVPVVAAIPAPLTLIEEAL